MAKNRRLIVRSIPKQASLEDVNIPEDSLVVELPDQKTIIITVRSDHSKDTVGQNEFREFINMTQAKTDCNVVGLLLGKECDFDVYEIIDAVAD